MIGASRDACNLILQLLTIFAQSSFRHLSKPEPEFLRDIPKTIPTVESKFNLSGRTTTYAVCPTCHFTYKPQLRLNSEIPIYPSSCTHTPTPESGVCGIGLLDNKGKPLKTFVYHHFNDYLAHLLSRKDIEEKMDVFCDENTATAPEYMGDVGDGSFIRSFVGPDGHRLFIVRGKEGRYLFALNVDYFAVEGNTARGAKTSVGVISMTCLNLPATIRNDAGLVYIAGIISGPFEPKLTEIMHYLRPVVDDFVTSWTRGVRYSRTACFPAGRTTRSAITIVVTDFPAGRATSGTAAVTSHHYCSVCTCYHLSTLGCTDFQKWQFKDKRVMREAAEHWLNANSIKEQNIIFQQHGTRYSELWRLPYWDPSKQLVVDSMHCIFERLVHQHVRVAMGLQTGTPGAPAKVKRAYTYMFRSPKPNSVPDVIDDDEPSEFDGTPIFTPPDILNDQRSRSLAELEENMTPIQIMNVGLLHDALLAPVKNGDVHLEALQEKLQKRNLVALKYVCLDLDCIPGILSSEKLIRKDYAASLVRWVIIIHFLNTALAYSIPSGAKCHLNHPHALTSIPLRFWVAFDMLSITQPGRHG